MEVWGPPSPFGFWSVQPRLPGLSMLTPSEVRNTAQWRGLAMVCTLYSVPSTVYCLLWTLYLVLSRSLLYWQWQHFHRIHPSVKIPRIRKILLKTDTSHEEYGKRYFIVLRIKALNSDSFLVIPKIDLRGSKRLVLYPMVRHVGLHQSMMFHFVTDWHDRTDIISYDVLYSVLYCTDSILYPCCVSGAAPSQLNKADLVRWHLCTVLYCTVQYSTVVRWHLSTGLLTSRRLLVSAGSLHPIEQ